MANFSMSDKLFKKLGFPQERIVFGTYNEGKVKELADLLGGTGFDLCSLAEFGSVDEVEETGMTFAENAALKARGYALQTDSWVIADDSGLEVAALGGRPGVFSARFAGKSASDEENTEKLLAEMSGIEDPHRTACFVCEIAFSDPEGVIAFTASGRCEGAIAAKPNGHNGFGYDPVFIPEGFKLTFGELGDETKQKISHRSKAAAKLSAFLVKFGRSST